MSRIQSGVNNDVLLLLLPLSPALPIDRPWNVALVILCCSYFTRAVSSCLSMPRGVAEMSERRGRDREYERNERTARSRHRMSKGRRVRNHYAVVQHLPALVDILCRRFAALLPPSSRGNPGVGTANLSRDTHMRLIVRSRCFSPPDKSIISYWYHATIQLNRNISWAGNETYRCRKTDQRLLLGKEPRQLFRLFSLHALALLFVRFCTSFNSRSKKFGCNYCLHVKQSR